jgi:hypothetical protein
LNNRAAELPEIASIEHRHKTGGRYEDAEMPMSPLGQKRADI